MFVYLTENTLDLKMLYLIFVSNFKCFIISDKVEFSKTLIFLSPDLVSEDRAFGDRNSN